MKTASAVKLPDRSKGIGSSEIAAVCGLSPFSSPLGVYLSKVDPSFPPETKSMRWGKLLEEVVAVAFEEVTGAEVVPPLLPTFFHEEKPIFFASLDRMAYHPDWDRPRILEIKTTREKTPDWGEEGSGQIPIHYYLQVQHQMEVMKEAKAIVACLFGGQDLAIYHIDKNDEVISKAWKTAEEFWHNYVEKRVPPMPNEQQLSYDEVTAWIAQYQPETVAPLLPCTEKILVDYKRLGKEISSLEKERLRLKALILQAMGDAQELRTLDGSVTVRRNQVTRPEYVVPQSTYHTLTLRGVPNVRLDGTVESARDRREQSHANPAGESFAEESLPRTLDPSIDYFGPE